MSCDNCDASGPVAYTLTTYVEGSSGQHVSLRFCSVDCLRAWT